MTQTVILSAKRSAVVPRNGAFASFSLHKLSAPVIHAACHAAEMNTVQIDEVIVSNALGAGGNPARSVALAAGISQHVAGLSIDRQCCGGLDALLLADAMIQSGQAQVVIAGGVESFSRRPLRTQTFADARPPEPYDQAPFTPWPDRDPDMSDAADALATQLDLSRAAQDDWAIDSHARALRADLASEIVEIAGQQRDAFTRALTTRHCAKAPVVTGNITAANAAVQADAAAFCVLTSSDVAKRLGKTGVNLITGCTVGADPVQPGLAPVPAIKAALAHVNLRPSDLTHAEIMEAYAAQAIACQLGAGIDPAIVNRGGGALARGHPIGASGAILAVRLFHELQRKPGIGLAAIAAAGGLGTAVILGN